MALIIDNKVTVTINGVSIKVPQGLNSFQDLIAPAVQKGAATAKAKLVTVNKAAAVHSRGGARLERWQGSTINPNGSYVVSGGEVFTIT